MLVKTLALLKKSTDPPGEAISIHHDWVDRYVMKYYCLSLMYSSVFLYFDKFFFVGYVRPLY